MDKPKLWSNSINCNWLKKHIVRFIQIHPEGWINDLNQISWQFIPCFQPLHQQPQMAQERCQRRSQGLNKVIRIYPLGAMNVCTRFKTNLLVDVEIFTGEQGITKAIRIYPQGTMFEFHNNLGKSMSMMVDRLTPCIASVSDSRHLLEHWPSTKVCVL